ncbi:cupin domain-containing protein [Sarocladium implicatum]|nr:cupin domain-containing protein [Sarocladium implicatum]
MAQTAVLTPLSSLRVSKHQIPACNLIPNTSIAGHPLIIYHSAFLQPMSFSVIESHLRSIAAVVPQWRYGMYTRNHFHSSTHEVLCVSAGRARIRFGGDDNEEKVDAVVEQGDVMVVPAGVSHCLLEDVGREDMFQMVGSYPPGCEWDMCYGHPDEQTKVEGIKDLPWFTKDPIYGDEGPVLDQDAQGTSANKN